MSEAVVPFSASKAARPTRRTPWPCRSARPRPRPNVAFDMQLRAANNVRVRSGNLDLGARGAVALTGTLAATGVAGPLRFDGRDDHLLQHGLPLGQRIRDVRPFGRDRPRAQRARDDARQQSRPRGQRFRRRRRHHAERHRARDESDDHVRLGPAIRSAADPRPAAAGADDRRQHLLLDGAAADAARSGATADRRAGPRPAPIRWSHNKRSRSSTRNSCAISSRRSRRPSETRSA